MAVAISQALLTHGQIPCALAQQPSETIYLDDVDELLNHDKMLSTKSGLILDQISPDALPQEAKKSAAELLPIHIPVRLIHRNKQDQIIPTDRHRILFNLFAEYTATHSLNTISNSTNKSDRSHRQKISPNQASAAQARKHLAAPDLLPSLAPIDSFKTADHFAIPPPISQKIGMRLKTRTNDFLQDVVTEISSHNLPASIAEHVSYRIERYPTNNSKTTGFYRLNIEVNDQAAKLPMLSKEVVVVVHPSQEQRELWDQPITDAAITILNSLSKGDRFNIAIHDSDMMMFSVDAIPVNERSLTRAKQFLSNYSHSDRNATSSIKSLLSTKPNALLSKNVVLISSPNNQELVNQVIAHALSHPPHSMLPVIHLIGIGSVADKHGTLGTVIAANGGLCLGAPQPGSLSVAISQITKAISHPIMNNVFVEIQSNAASESQSFQTNSLHKGQTISTFGLYELPDTLHIWFTGQTSSSQLDSVFSIDLGSARRGHPEIKQQWAREKMVDLMRKVYQNPDSVESRQALADHCNRYGLKLPDL